MHIADGEIQLPSAITITYAENSLASGDPRNSRYNFCLISAGRTTVILGCSPSILRVFSSRERFFLNRDSIFSLRGISLSTSDIHGFSSVRKTGSIWLIGNDDLFLKNERPNILYSERTLCQVVKRKNFINYSTFFDIVRALSANQRNSSVEDGSRWIFRDAFTR